LCGYEDYSMKGRTYRFISGSPENMRCCMETTPTWRI